MALAIALALAPSMAHAQATLRETVPGWIGLIAAPGREGAATDAIMHASPGWTRGPLGSLVRRAGSGSPRRVIACSLDRPTYSVSEITADGYVRVHNAEPTGRHPLWDQFHEGQRVLIQKRDGGVVPGVFAVRSNHLWRRRAQLDALVTADDLWLDVGAGSAAEATSLGLRILDPVVRELPAWTYGPTGDPFIAGPGAVARTGCAVVAALAMRAPTTGENIYVIAAQSSFANAGLSATIARLGPVNDVVVAGADGNGISPTERAPTTTVFGAIDIYRVPLRGMGTFRSPVSWAMVRSGYTGSLMESVRSSEVDALASVVAAAAGLVGSATQPVLLPAPAAAPAVPSRRDATSSVADLLGRLTDIYSLSSHEAPMREAVRAALPAWARARAVVDTAGNLIVGVGPERDTSLVIAHMDEIGFDVTAVAPDGTVSLRTRGSFYSSLWEGQPALLHVGAQPGSERVGGACGAASGGPLRGMFVPRDSAAHRQPPALRAWFGLDSAALVARGVGIGSAITGYKCSTRLAGTRMAARSIDDRAGVTALLLAIGAIDERKLTHKTIFVWSVREEVGLEGAAAAGALFGPNVHRVHAVDTFVSADSPLEGHRFGFAPLGAGAVIRALDNSSVTPPEEVDRVLGVARSRGIPLQVGTTNGGNDGSELVRYGAINVPVAWPLRYSHSPAEVADVRDIRAMGLLIKALVEQP